MKITIKLSETNNALLNRVVKEEKVDASEFANSAFLDKFLPVSESWVLKQASSFRSMKPERWMRGSLSSASPVESVGWGTILSVTAPF